MERNQLDPGEPYDQYAPEPGVSFDNPFRGSASYRQFDWAKEHPQIANALGDLLGYIGMVPMGGHAPGAAPVARPSSAALTDHAAMALRVGAGNVDAAKIGTMRSFGAKEAQPILDSMDKIRSIAADAVRIAHGDHEAAKVGLMRSYGLRDAQPMIAEIERMQSGISR